MGGLGDCVPTTVEGIQMRKHDRILGVWGLGVAGLAGLAGLAGCSQTHPVRVDSDYGPGIKLYSVGSNFAWRPGFDATWKDPAAPYYDVKIFARDRIVHELEERGFTRSTAETADFWVDYRFSSEERGDPYDQFTKYEMGILVMHVIDPRSRLGIWRGWAESRMVESAPPEQRREAICKAVEEVLDRFPYLPQWTEDVVVEGPFMEEVIIEGPVIEGEAVPLTQPAGL